MVFDAALNVVFGPLLKLSPFVAISILSFLVSLFIVLIYKWMSDQKEMKRLKDELKDYQTKLKTLKDNPEKMMETQKQMMQVNMQYMGKSMKPTLITFIPVLLIFGWMSAHLAYEPLLVGEEFSVSVLAQKGIGGNVSIEVPDSLQVIGSSEKEFVGQSAEFVLKSAKEGDYLVTFVSGSQEVDKRVLISSQRDYAPVSESYKSSVFKSVTINNKPLKAFWKLNWFWTYFVVVVVFSVLLRKLFKVH